MICSKKKFKNKSIIYTAFNYDVVPAFLSAHLYSLKQYSREIGCELQIISKSTDYLNKRFIKQLAYEHFVGTEAKQMLWVDTDTIINPNSPNIFQVYGDAVFAARKMDDDGWNFQDEHNNLQNFITLFNKDKLGCDFKKIKKQYFTAGVMLISQEIAEDFLYHYKQCYSRLKKISRSKSSTQIINHLKGQCNGIFRDEFITNYIISKLTIPVTYITDKWNWSLGTFNSPREKFRNDAYITHFDVPSDDKEQIIFDYIIDIL